MSCGFLNADGVMAQSGLAMSHPLENIRLPRARDFDCVDFTII